jgi:hydroxyacylglutathione hydrolase
LPDFVQIWPAHGAGSACGRALGAIPSSTLGYERRFSWWSHLVAADDEEGFIAALLEGQPDAPTYFARQKHLNRGLTPILGTLPQPQRLDAKALRTLLSSGALLIDTRMRDEFCAQHVQGAISVPDRPSFSTRSAWFATPDRPIVLLAKPERVEDLVRKLVRVGLDDIAGYIGEVTEAQMPTASVPQVAVDEAKRRWSADEATVLDVRQRGEFAEAHIPHAMNVSAGNLVAKIANVPKDRPLLVMCAGGDRSVAASSVLAALGFENVTNVTEGFDSWRSQGLPVESGLVRS